MGAKSVSVTASKQRGSRLFGTEWEGMASELPWGKPWQSGLRDRAIEIGGENQTFVVVVVVVI